MFKPQSSRSLLLTFDIEDWFQVENFKDWISYESWETQESRVVRATYRILDLLDSVAQTRVSSSAASDCAMVPIDPAIKATFFVLGWVADKFPELIVEIHARGHEVASHGYRHELANQMGRDALQRDLMRSKIRLEDIIGAEVSGYRAPSFSISDKVLDQIHNAGYHYDSSFNDFALHGRYGTCAACRLSDRRVGIAIPLAADFYEIPISNLKWGNLTIPLGGGGYFRLMPFPFYRRGVRRIIENEHAHVMYLHPWEFDPDQPKVTEASFFYRFRHTVNLKQTYPRLKKLIECFSECEFLSCRQYLDKVLKTPAPTVE